MRAAAAVLAVLALALTGCDKDAPKQPAKDITGIREINMPNGYPNVAAVCDGPNMVYALAMQGNGGTGMYVVPDDPRCPGGAR